MKIVCDSCSAKYSIADEKVAGRVFKIRCKKCGAAIVVRGDEIAVPEEEEASTRVVDFGGDAVWHIVIDGDQQGPYAPGQIGEMLAAGTIQWDAFVWREGYEDWKPAQDIEELVAAVMGGADGAAAAAPQDDAHAADAGMGADPFAASAPTDASAEGGGLFGAEAAVGGRDAGADLFAQSDSASPFGPGADEDEDVVASTPGGPRVSAEQALTGARNENSVLFSLSNLQALATGPSGGGGSPGVSGGPSPISSKAGMAAGEGSGLIDIRALASATGVMNDGGGAFTSASDDKVDDLLSIGGTGGGLGSSLGAPVLIPESRDEGSNKGLIIGIGVAGIAVVAAAAVVAVVLIKGDPPPPAALGTVGQVTSGETTVPTTPAAGDPSTPAGGTAPTESSETPTVAGGGDEDEGGGEGDEGGDDEASGGSGGGGGGAAARRRRRRAGGASSGARRGTSSGGRGGSTSSGGGGGGGGGRRGGSDIDRLLDDALGGGGGGGGGGRRGGRGSSSSGGGGGGGGAAASGPQTPSRGSVVGAMRAVSGAVRACGNGAHGTAPVRIVFSGSNGRVTSAQVSGNFPGPVRSCIARAVRAAHVPPFRQSSFSINFPFSL